MASKLFLVSATLALCFLLTNASIYRTVVEFDEDDATNPMGPYRSQQKCQREFQQAKHLRSCQQWMRQQTRQGRGGSPALVDEFDFEDDIENPQQRQPILQQCCNELQQEDPVCVCPTLKQAARSVRLQGQHGPYQASKILQTAKRLPNICNIPQVGVCPFRASPYYPPY
ncbi:hypothetical protein CARUB_v10007322mg [Capsella rubella]|uniref:Bifunctional inhibitor/plant lipid transfer protein/seed storage helical domain-containing protein n=1 Tax=Capsella rubella TaxID=81985 RepID=R0FAI3_9BRAS|nr:2S seed storage protein 2 [Capsella rubella]EOA18741.1 hypothetical protein CARUB_v10007322mg [Capsella rubella]